MEPSITPIPAEDIRDQIIRICAGPELENSPRLRELLNYITDEFLAGRAGKIKGFTIGRALYATDNSFDADSNSIVRVEAARLRQRLAEYYATTGNNDPVVIEIPKGTYVPIFKKSPRAPRGNSSSLPKGYLKLVSKNRWLIAGALVFTILLTFSSQYFDEREDNDSGEISLGEFDRPFNGSEAEILFQQGFVLLMPPEDDTRLSASIDIFQRVIDLDSNFGGGYAGKSIAFLFRILFVKSENPVTDLQQALVLAKNAVDKDPEYSLGYAALALAQSLNAEPNKSLASIRRLMVIQPQSENANTLAAVSLIINGETLKAIELLSEALKRSSGFRTPILNLLGIAQYLNGDFSEAEKSIKKNLIRTGPTGPHMDVFLAATYAQMGKDFEAQAVIEKLQRTHPGYPAKSWLGNFIKSEDELQAIMSKVQLLGLPKRE
jgi:tetratricopeptide (TPR) repeat protein